MRTRLFHSSLFDATSPAVLTVIACLARALTVIATLSWVLVAPYGALKSERSRRAERG
jgi:hypothetical protein